MALGFWLVFCATVDAFQILSKYSNLLVRNGTRMTDTVLSVRCAPSDMNVEQQLQLQSDNGVVHAVTVQCMSVQRVYRAKYSGVIPSDGELESSVQCASQSTENITLADPELVPRHSRVLLESDERLRNFLDSSRNPLTFESSRFPGVNKLTLQRLCRQWAPSSAMPQDQFINTCLNGGANLDIMSQLRGSQQDLEKKLEGFSQLMTNLNSNETLAIELLVNATVVFGNYSSVVKQQLDLQANTTALTRAQMNDTLRYVTLNNQNTLLTLAGDTANIKNLSDSIKNLATTGQSNFQQAFADVAQNFANQSAALLESTVRRKEDKALFYEQMQTVRQMFVDTITEFEKVQRDEDMLAAHNAEIQRKLEIYKTTPNSNGRTLFPFVVDPGLAPVQDRYSLPSQKASVVFSYDAIRYVTLDTDTGLPFGVLTTLGFACDTVWSVTTDPVGPGWRDFYSWIGPSGCDHTWTTKSPRCKCAILVEEKRCRLSNSTAGLWLDADSALRADSVAGCTDSAVTNFDSSMPVAVRSHEDLISAFQRISQRVLYSQEFPGYRFVATYPKIEREVMFLAGLANITSVTGFMNPDADSNYGDNLFYTFMRTLEVSYRIRRDNMQAYRDLVYGRLPTGMTDSEKLFDRTPSSGDTGRCTRFDWMMYSNEFLTVTELQFDSTSTEVRVTVDGRATSFYDTQIRNPYDSLLPGVTSIVWAPSQGDSRAWDTGDDDVQSCAFKQSCRGTLVYPMVPSADQFTLEAWEKNASRKFDHPSGSVVASYYEVSIDSNISSPTYGRCRTLPLAGGGGWCILRDHFQVVYTGVFNDPNTDGTVILLDRDASYTGTLTLPSGEYSRILSSDCPRIGTPVAHIDDQLIIPITNSAPSVVDVRVTQLGACPSTLLISLPPKQTLNLDRRVCPLGAPGSPDTVGFEVRSSGGSFKSCPGQVELVRFNVTAERSRFRGTASLALAARINSITNNQTLVYMALARYDLLSLLMSASAYSLQSKLNMGYRVSNSTFASYSAIIEQLRRVKQDTEDLARTSAAAAGNITSNSKSIGEIFDSYQRLRDSLQRQANGLLVEFASGVEKAVIQSKVLKRLGALTKKQLRDTVTAWNTFFRACLEAQNRTVGNCNWRDANSTCWDKLGRFMADIGTMDPDTAGCAPSGLVGFFGGSASDAFAEAFNGCGKGNFIATLAVIAVLIVGATLLAVACVYVCWPVYQRRRAGKERGTRSTTFSDPDDLVALDQELTRLENQLRVAQANATKTNKNATLEEEETASLVGGKKYKD